MADGAESHNDPLGSDEGEELEEQAEQIEQRPEMNMLSDDYGNQIDSDEEVAVA